MLNAITERIKFEIEWLFTEELEGLLWVTCAIVIPTALVFFSAYMDGAL
jgi:hypothetical protein